MEWNNKAPIICKQTAWARVSGAERSRFSPSKFLRRSSLSWTFKTRRLLEKEEMFISGWIFWGARNLKSISSMIFFASRQDACDCCHEEPRWFSPQCEFSKDFRCEEGFKMWQMD